VTEPELTVEQIAPLEALFDEGYPERLREMALYLYLELVEDDDLVAAHGAQRLAQLALDQTERLCQELGGESFYMHRAVRYKLSRRDRQIIKEHRGNNTHLLARKYGLTEMRIRQIVNAWEEQERARRQGSLPLDGADP
jgi:Mor family transcriptional regulator